MFRLMTLAVGALSVSGCSDVCSNTLISSIEAPGGLHVATMFQRDCGATTGFTTQVSVLEAGERPSEGGNAFVADDDHGAASVGEWRGPWAEMRWMAEDHLLIRYASRSRIFKQDQQVSGVRISYQLADP